MPQSMISQNFPSNPLNPLYAKGETLLCLPVNLVPSTVFPRGQVLGEITASANDVQTLTVTNTPTSGAATVTGVNPLTGATFSFAVAFDSSAAAAQTAIRAAFGSGSAGVAVTGGVWPGTGLVFTFTGALAAIPVPLMTAATNTLAGSGSTPVPTVAHTTTGRTANTYAPYSGATITAPTTGPTVAGNGSGSSFGAGTYGLTYTIVNAQGETTPSPVTFVTITANQNLRVSAITGMHASATSVNFYVDGMRAGSSAVTAGDSVQTDLTGASITVTGQPPLTNTAYTIGNGAGTQTAKCILKYACATDASGNITFGAAATGGEWGQTLSYGIAWFEGDFKCEDLTGLDAKAVSDLGRLISGTTSAGVLHVT